MFGAKKNNTKIIEQLEKKCNGLGDILRSIGNTMAVIEFTTDGVILEANQNFLTTMKYSLSESRVSIIVCFVCLKLLILQHIVIFGKI